MGLLQLALALSCCQSSAVIETFASKPLCSRVCLLSPGWQFRSSISPKSSCVQNCLGPPQKLTLGILIFTKFVPCIASSAHGPTRGPAGSFGGGYRLR